MSRLNGSNAFEGMDYYEQVRCAAQPDPHCLQARAVPWRGRRLLDRRASYRRNRHGRRSANGAESREKKSRSSIAFAWTPRIASDQRQQSGQGA